MAAGYTLFWGARGHIAGRHFGEIPAVPPEAEIARECGNILRSQQKRISLQKGTSMERIRNEKEYSVLMDRIDELFFTTNESTPLTDPRLQELDRLSASVEEYEKSCFCQ